MKSWIVHTAALGAHSLVPHECKACICMQCEAYEKVLLLSICGGVHAAENFNLLLSSCTTKQHLFEVLAKSFVWTQMEQQQNKGRCLSKYYSGISLI